MRRSPNRYRAPTRVHRPNHLPYIFNTARLRSASGHIRRLAQTVLHLFLRCLILLLALRICAQLIGRPPAAPEKLVTDPNQPNLPSGNDHRLECPHSERIDDCLSCLFGNQTGHGPGQCDLGCPRTVVTAVSGGHLNTSHFEFPLQDILLHTPIWRPQTVPVGPEGPSGQCHLPLPVASYNPAFRAMFNEMTAVLDFILWHTTLVAFNTLLRLSLLLHEYGPADLTKRETWRKFKKTASLSGKRGISSPCGKIRVFLCIFVRCPLTVCVAVVKRYKHQAVSKQVCGLLAKLPSLRLQRGVKSGRKIHGRLVVSFTVQRSFVIRIRSHRSTFCLAFLRRAACIGKWLSQAVFKPYIFLRGLLLLAGDVEPNPGPIQAEHVLMDYRDRFLSEMDANAVFRELFHHSIISDGDQKRIAKEDSPRQQNTILHACLVRKCTDEALMTACDIIIAVKGNPKMATLGKDIQRSLESVEGGGPDGGSGSEGKKVQSFFSRMQEHYVSMQTVQDEWFPNQAMSYVNLALAPFRLGYQQAQERFVEAVKEGADYVYTYQSGKVECEAIPGLVNQHKLVILSGAPGVGKSTLARKVCQDVCRSPSCLGYSLVLLVELRKLLHFKKDFKLVDVLQLFQGMMGETTSPEELSKAIHRNLGRGVLFILDGFDELPPHLRQSDFLANLLSHNLECSAPLPYCHVIMTSRSIVTSQIYRNVQGSITNVEVLGFTWPQIKEYAGHILVDQGRPDLLDSFVRKLDSVPQIRGLCSIPVVLSIICQVFLFREDLPPTLTQIYNEYLCVKLLKYHKDLSTLDSILDLSKDHDIYKLGEIAYNCIQSQKIVFDSADLQGLGERFSDRERGCGVLTARPVRANPWSEKAVIKSFFFIHLTVQEFIAAVYVALLPAETQCKIWAKYLGEPHMAQVWRFYCGLSKLEHFQIFEEKITAYSKDFQMQCLFECQNASLVRQLMPHIVGEKVTVEPKTAYDSTAYGYCLSKHPALQTFTIKTQRGTGSVEIHRLLEPVYASGRLQTWCLPGDSNWREIEVALDRLVSQEREASTGDSQKDGALKGHFGKVLLQKPPVSVAVKVLYLQHVREVECQFIQGCEAMDPEVLREMEKALEENKTLETLSLNDGVAVTLPKEFCHHVLLGARRSTSLSDVHLDFESPNWDCPDDVSADSQGSVQHVTLWNVPVNVLPKLWSWFSQVKQLECHHIHPPQEDGVRKQDMWNEVEQALSKMGRWEKLVLGTNLPDLLLVTFGVAILKGMSSNQHIREFVLYDLGERDNVLHNMLGRLKPRQRTMFTTGRYSSSPCILLSASGPTHQPLELTVGVSPAPHQHEPVPPPALHPPSRRERAGKCCCCTML